MNPKKKVWTGEEIQAPTMKYRLGDTVVWALEHGNKTQTKHAVKFARTYLNVKLEQVAA